MLDWFKRSAANGAAEPSVEEQQQLRATEEKLERLVGRLRGGEFAVVKPDQPPVIDVAPERQLVPLPEPGNRLPVEHAGPPSDMRVVVVASQKGGSGKTTIAAHLAVQAGLAGDGPAVLVDTDPQASLAEWWQARDDDSLTLATAKPGDLAAMRGEGLLAHLAELRRRGFAVAVVDTPPALTSAIEQVIAVADLVLIPARPSPHDLRAVAATVDMARRAGKPFLFIVNGAAQRANITVQAVAALSEHGPVSPVILYQRTDYAASMIDGRTVLETGPAGRSAKEIAALWKHVHSRIAMRAAA